MLYVPSILWSCCAGIRIEAFLALSAGSWSRVHFNLFGVDRLEIVTLSSNERCNNHHRMCGQYGCDLFLANAVDAPSNLSRLSPSDSLE